jgi:hypothetical protein
MHRAVSGAGYCDACFTGNYPVAFPRTSHGPRRQLALLGV